MAHYYNPETGSNNISKATQEWKEVWDRARDNETPLKHPLHAAYEEINTRVAQGEMWAKCANCGSPYQMTEEWSDGTVCSRNCHAAYVSYLTNDRLFNNYERDEY